MSQSSSLATNNGSDELVAIRRRFVDNDAPVVLSFKTSGQAARRLRGLVGWPGEWIGSEVDTPDAAAIVRAEALLDGFQRAGAGNDNWQEPHVSAGQDGEVALEWWGPRHKITVYVSAGSAVCLRVWGPDVDTEMDEIEIQGPADLTNLWDWLNR